MREIYCCWPVQKPLNLAHTAKPKTQNRHPNWLIFSSVITKLMTVFFCCSFSLSTSYCIECHVSYSLQWFGIWLRWCAISLWTQAQEWSVAGMDFFGPHQMLLIGSRVFALIVHNSWKKPAPQGIKRKKNKHEHAHMKFYDGKYGYFRKSNRTHHE